MCIFVDFFFCCLVQMCPFYPIHVTVVDVHQNISNTAIKCVFIFKIKVKAFLFPIVFLSLGFWFQYPKNETMQHLSWIVYVFVILLRLNAESFQQGMKRIYINIYLPKYYERHCGNAIGEMYEIIFNRNILGLVPFCIDQFVVLFIMLWHADKTILKGWKIFMLHFTALVLVRFSPIKLPY